MPVPTFEQLRRIFEKSHNAYTFRYRGTGLQIVIEKMPDKSIFAYYADDRAGSVTIDTSQPPFDKIVRFSYNRHHYLSK